MFFPLCKDIVTCGILYNKVETLAIKDLMPE